MTQPIQISDQSTHTYLSKWSSGQHFSPQIEDILSTNYSTNPHQRQINTYYENLREVSSFWLRAAPYEILTTDKRST